MKRIIDEEVIGRTGGRFKLSVLLQKRLREYFLSGMTDSEADRSPLSRAVSEVRSGHIRLEAWREEEEEKEEEGEAAEKDEGEET